MDTLDKYSETVGAISISWLNYPEPVAVNHQELNGKAPYVTQTQIVYRHGDYVLLVPARFKFDAASIPRIFWIVPGFQPLGRHMWATLAHDYICENPKVLPRSLGDALFGILLRGTKGIPWWQAIAMSAAVKVYSVIRALRR